MPTIDSSGPRASYLDYWGKADPAIGGYHLAAFHCLDVAAVGERWLLRHPVLHRKLAIALQVEETQVAPTTALFIALHDFGKFDARFQVKAPAAAVELDPGREGLPIEPYDHGHAGFHQLRELVDVLRARLGKVTTVVPARAGMNRSRGRCSAWRPRGPRTRGNEPAEQLATWSPHGRR